MRLAQTVQQHNSGVKVLVTGLVESNALIIHYLEHGVSGYVLENDSFIAFVQKIRVASRGECLMSPTLTKVLLNRLCELKQTVNELCGVQAMNPTTLYDNLTARECEVLSLIEQGRTNLQISDTLYIESGTVKNHVHNLLEKLGVQSRRQAAIMARQVFVPASAHALLMEANTELYATTARYSG